MHLVKLTCRMKVRNWNTSWVCTDLHWKIKPNSLICRKSAHKRNCIAYFPAALGSAPQSSSVERNNAFQCVHHLHLLSLHFRLMKLLYINIKTFKCCCKLHSKTHYTDAYKFHYYLHVNDTIDLRTCKTWRPIYEDTFQQLQSTDTDTVLSLLQLLVTAHQSQ